MSTPPKAAAKAEAPALVAEVGEVLASHVEHGDRIFSTITWAAIADREGNRDGWDVKAAKPAELDK